MLLELRNVSFEYKTQNKTIEALKNISLKINQGSFVSIIGTNGSGKSTFAMLLNALEKPTGGKVLVNGLDTLDDKNIVEIRKTVGLVFQNPDNQIIGDTVEEDVAFGPENLGLSPEEIERKIQEALQAVGLTDERLTNPNNLSGGQKQRCAIAAELAMGSLCIVLDEATSMLDPKGRTEVLSYLHKLNKEQCKTIIQITQNVDECIDSDLVIVLNKGTIVTMGNPNMVFSQYNLLKEIGLDVPLTCELAHKMGFENVVTKEQLIEKLREVKDAQRS